MAKVRIPANFTSKIGRGGKGSKYKAAYGMVRKRKHGRHSGKR